MTSGETDWTRTVDDPNFTFLGFGEIASSCRMQVLRSRRGDVLLVAVQHWGKEGTSLVNGAEAALETAWKAYVPDLATPPPMHARFTGTTNSSDDDLTILVRDEGGRFWAQWRQPSPEEWSAIQDHADFDRGAEWNESPDHGPTDWIVWRDLPVASLPKSNIWKHDWVEVTKPTQPRRRLFSRPQPALAPRHPIGVEDCCRFHAGSWKAAYDAARRALLSIGRQPLVNTRFDVEREVWGWLDRHISDHWIRSAAASLIDRPIKVAGQFDFVNGAHRSQAMRDQLVAATIVVQSVPIGSGHDTTWLLVVPHV